MRYIETFAFGSGQLFKDLINAVNSAFFIIYLQNCMSIPKVAIGTLLLVGQVFNAIITPLTGLVCDKVIQRRGDSPNSSSADSGISQPQDTADPTSCSIKKCLTILFSPRRYKAWHLYGNGLLLIGFTSCYGHQESFASLDLPVKLAIIGSMLIVLQIGWAVVQLSYLAMINLITCEPSERVLLVSARYFFSSVSDISAFFVSYLLLTYRNTADSSPVVDQLFGVNSNESIFDGNNTVPLITANITSASSNASALTIDDLDIFQKLTISMAVYGLFFVAIFQIFVKEKPAEKSTDITSTRLSLALASSLHSSLNEIDNNRLFTSTNIDDNSTLGSNEADIDAVNGSNKNRSSLATCLQIFKLPKFWLTCVIFGMLRMSVTIAQFYLSPFLLETLGLHPTSCALIPLAIQSAALVTTLTQKLLAKKIGNVCCGLIGIGIRFVNVAMFWVLSQDPTNTYLLYSSALVYGIGLSFNYVTAVVVISDLIADKHTGSAAFIHGFASSFDKLLTGMTFQFIQLVDPTQSTYLHVEVYVIGSFLLIAGLGLLVYWVEERSCNMLAQRKLIECENELEDGRDQSASALASEEKLGRNGNGFVA